MSNYLDQRPWSAVEVEMKCQEIVEKIDDQLSTFMALSETAAGKRAGLKLAESQFHLATKTDPNLDYLTTDALRKAWVNLQVGDAQLEAELAEGIAKAASKTLDLLKTQADLLRSLLRSKRDQEEQPGWGYGGRSREPERV